MRSICSTRIFHIDRRASANTALVLEDPASPRLLRRLIGVFLPGKPWHRVELCFSKIFRSGWPECFPRLLSSNNSAGIQRGLGPSHYYYATWALAVLVVNFVWSKIFTDLVMLTGNEPQVQTFWCSTWFVSKKHLIVHYVTMCTV